jgi:hypothetical protein
MPSEKIIAALGTQEQKTQLKKQLELKVFAGRGTGDDVGLLIFLCGQLGDRECVTKAVQLQATKGATPGSPTSVPSTP